tara:strand:+ start:1182 stop:1565 length:384 start_codon:yes stop_codon:yes gene_type:complete
MSKNEKLKKLYLKYNLTPNDVFTSPLGFTIIRRSGIDKIQGVERIEIAYNIESLNEKHEYCVIKAVAKKDENYIETFGESSPLNTSNKYPVAMAEKRAMSRAVLKLTGFYELGVFGEDESEEFKKQL